MMTKKAIFYMLMWGTFCLAGPAMMAGCGMVQHCMNNSDCGADQQCVQGFCLPLTGKGCTYNGKTYKERDTFPSSDGCNTCSCNNGLVACTLKACVKGCTYDGKQYKEGESFPATDGCNTCTCSGGKVACTEKACGQQCGSRGLPACPKDQYCDQPAHCGATDIPGVCKPKPQGCTKEYKPVCGCDGKTYGNACSAASNGVSVKSTGACSGNGGKSCTDSNGLSYKHGEKFQAADGCNICTCNDGQISCTDKACSNTCTYNGKTYKDGEKFPATDGCNTCFCYSGQVKCTLQVCPQNCTYDGKTYKDGEKFPATDGCNTCYCRGGQVSCTKINCSGTCTYNGKTYKDGERFPATDGCNTCTCSGGKIACTEKACAQKCGSRGLPACAKDQYCDLSTHCGATDIPGVCRTKPQTCDQEYSPVCGCDGKNYGNACMAASAGVSLKSITKCPATCTYNGKTYKDGESFPATDGCNKCTCSNGVVGCTKIACPQYCTYNGKQYKDGETFPATDGCNTCYCRGGLVSCTKINCPATCTYNGKTYKDGEAFPATDGCNKCTCKNGQVGCTKIACPKTCTYNGNTYKDGETFPAIDGCNTCSCTGGLVACTQRACAQKCGSRGLTPCPSGQYCDQPSHCGATDIPGVCKTKPQNCTQQYDPVCGCDGKTYGNECTAASAGVSVKSKGACSSGKSCTLPDGRSYKDGETFPAGDGCNLCTCRNGVPACTKIACQPGQCRANSDCQQKGQYCAWSVGQCGSIGTCTTRPQACTQQCDPVCGCDGKTYGNACTAASAGVSVKSKGQCP